VEELRPWFVAFVVTCAIEVPIAAYALREYKKGALRRAALAFFANLSTHPSVWFVFPVILHGAAYYVVAEAFAFVAEAIFFRVAFPRAGLVRAIAVSALANATSFAVGLLLPPSWFSR
jgi:hypothetical protein